MGPNIIRIACIIGTRPEVIKMAPIINAIRLYSNLKIFIISTAQHRQLLDNMLRIFVIRPDVDLNVMQDNQSLGTLTGNLFIKLAEVFATNSFDWVLAQGDTTTTLVAAQMAFYYRIQFGHVEAGLRSYNMYQPFPEEMNRVLISKMATWHFAPTSVEKDNLLRENISPNKIIVTGNTVIDSLYLLSKKDTALPFELPINKRIILLTLHRRESFGEPIRQIFSALLEIANKFEDIIILYPVHPNPSVQQVATEILKSHPRVRLLEPLGYDVFVTLMCKAYLIMSDSGGIQEEAPALDKPIIVLRDVTERPLIIELGLGLLVGSNKENIVNTVTELLIDPHKYQSMQKHLSPYGDGHAAERIVNIINTHV